MKFKSLSALLFICATLTVSSGCGKRQTPITAYPNVQQYQQDPSLGNGYNPYQQGVGANPSYYGNNANYNIDNSGNWETTTAAPSTSDIPTTSGDTTSVDTNSQGDSLELDLPNLQPYAPPSGSNSGANYSLAGTFNVDQDNYLPPAVPFVGSLMPTRNQWQASGIAVVGSDVVITATDKSGLFKKGTVITMNSETGQNWRNIGSKWLGVRHPMDATVKGIVFDGSGKLYANDSTNFLYVLSEPSFSVEKLTSSVSGSIDIGLSGGGVILGTSSGLKKLSPDGSSAVDFASGVNATGGMGNDSAGNLYVISGTSIKKITPDGNVSDVVSGISGGIDVTATDDGNIMILTSGGIKMYSGGQLKNTFGSGDYVNALAIATDGKSVFVADSGSSYKDSKVLKYSTMSL